jgi:hypothetical protein
MIQLFIINKRESRIRGAAAAAAAFFHARDWATWWK